MKIVIVIILCVIIFVVFAIMLFGILVLSGDAEGDCPVCNGFGKRGCELCGGMGWVPWCCNDNDEEDYGKCHFGVSSFGRDCPNCYRVKIKKAEK